MTIEDQIRNEKLQHDINRETAKVSALLSRKIDKYEYLTGEEVLPSNQKQIIQQAKFSYSPLGKTFKEKIKTIKEQGEKQIKQFKTKDLFIEKFTYDIDDVPMVLIEKEINNKLTEESFEKINNSKKMVDTGKLLFKYKSNTADQDFSKFDNALDLTNKKKEGKISLIDTKDDQARLKSDMGETKRVQNNIC